MILLKIPQDEFNIEDIRRDPRTVYRSLHRSAKLHIEEKLSDPEAYVPEIYVEDEAQCIFGAVEPGRLQEAVLQWNASIRDNLLKAIGAYILSEGAGQTDPAAALDTAATYSMKKATLAADNCFFDFSEFFVYPPNEQGFTWLESAISSQNLAAILAAPEQYAIVPVYVQ